MKNYIKVLSVLFSVLLILFTGCQGKGKIKIGALLPLSGSLKEYGETIQNGIELAVNEINTEGGINGNKVKMVYKDTKGKAKNGKKKIKELINKEGVCAVIGAVSSSVTLKVAPLAQSNKIILLSPASSTPKLSKMGGYVFRNYPSDAIEASFMANFLKKREEIKNIVILASKSNYSRGIRKAFKDSFEKEDKTAVLKNFLYTADKPDTIKAKLKELKDFEKDYDAIYLVGYSTDMSRAVKEIRKAKIDKSIYSVSSFYSKRLIKSAGKAAEGIVFPIPYDLKDDDEKYVNFRRNYMQKYNSSFTMYAAYAYDAVGILKKAIQKKGAMPGNIRDGLASMSDYMGASGRISFTQNGDVVRTPEMVTIKNGKCVPFEAGK